MRFLPTAILEWGGYGGSFADPDGYIWNIDFSAQGQDRPCTGVGMTVHSARCNSFFRARDNRGVSLTWGNPEKPYLSRQYAFGHSSSSCVVSRTLVDRERTDSILILGHAHCATANIPAEA